MTQNIASYALWLRYEHASTSDALLREGRPDGWFEKRASWLKELIEVLALSADDIAAEMRRMHDEGVDKGEFSRDRHMDF